MRTAKRAKEQERKRALFPLELTVEEERQIVIEVELLDFAFPRDFLSGRVHDLDRQIRAIVILPEQCVVRRLLLLEITGFWRTLNLTMDG